MATVTLTARYLDQLKSHGKRYEVFDAIVPGLAIRVSASGRKTFTLYYRHHRRMRRAGLGRYPDVLLEEARKIATQHRGRIFDGADPAGEKQTEHTQDENTVQALYELYRRRKVLRSWSEVRRILEKEVLPTLAASSSCGYPTPRHPRARGAEGTDGPDPGQPRA
jgi:hypothetical protein